MLVLAGRLWVALIFSDSTSHWQSSQLEVALAQGLLRLGVQIQLPYRAARGQLGRRGPPGNPGPSPPRVDQAPDFANGGRDSGFQMTLVWSRVRASVHASKQRRN